MDRLPLAISITIGIMVYLLVVYSLLKNYKAIKESVATDAGQKSLMKIRFTLLSFVLIWGVLEIFKSTQETNLPGLSLIYIIPIITILTAVFLIPWEKTLKVTPVFVYVTILGFTAAYINLLNLVKIIYSSLAS